MKLSEALKIVHDAEACQADPLLFGLACGFTPLHLQTFLQAHLQQRFPHRKIAIQTGRYGNSLEGIVRLPATPIDSLLVVLEWADFDSRLGLRQLGNWGPSQLQDIVAHCNSSATQFLHEIEKGADRQPVAVSLPTLPQPNVSHHAPWEKSPFQASLETAVAQLSQQLSNLENVRQVSAEYLAIHSPPADRLDAKSAIVADFPYRTAHANSLAEQLANTIAPPPPKKGIITDLDGTLWQGIVGEIGPQQIAWDLDHLAQVHGWYQQTLAALAEAGVLIAVASKNSPEVVQQAFTREDLLLRQDSVFPVLASWNPKSQAVSQTLKAWNLRADSVLFIDDSPMEIAEVQSVHPELECLLFTPDDPNAVQQLLARLRELFGKAHLGKEDAIRLSSLRSANTLPTDADDGQSDAETGNLFLQQAVATIQICVNNIDAQRAFQLVNKTNQFNLNGYRLTEAEWRTIEQDPQRQIITLAYHDKFGPLGTIATLIAAPQEDRLKIQTWVMSCRAFSRQIEHAALRWLFDTFDVSQIEFALEKTDRNGPLCEFLAEMSGDCQIAASAAGSSLVLSREQFERACPELFHTLEVFY